MRNLRARVFTQPRAFLPIRRAPEYRPVSAENQTFILAWSGTSERFPEGIFGAKCRAGFRRRKVHAVRGAKKNPARVCRAGL
jgi:hypothetical protein